MLTAPFAVFTPILTLGVILAAAAGFWYTISPRENSPLP
jgi:hypothetical protein